MDILPKLRSLALEMGGKIIASSGTSVGFSLPDEDEDSQRLLFKLSVRGEHIILTQLSGPAKGKSDTVGSLETMGITQVPEAG